MSFDINRTWEGGVALVKGNFQLLALIAGLFLLVPTVIFYLAFPQAMTSPEAMGNGRSAAENWDFLARFLPAILLMLVVQMIGYLAMISLIGGKRPTVGEAIGNGVRALPTLLATGVTIFAISLIGGALLGIGLTIVLAIMAMIFGQGALIAMGVVVYVVVLVAMFYLYVRLSPLLPVIAIERKRGFLHPLKRAWELTKGSSRRLMAFFGLLFVAYLVIAMVLGIAFLALGWLTVDAEGGGSFFAFGLVSALLGAFVSMLLSGILVSVHRQLAGAAPPERESDDFDA